MGADLMYKLVHPSDTDAANVFLEAQPEMKALHSLERGFGFWCKADQDYELKRLKTTGCGAPDFHKIGEGSWKASGMSEEEEKACYPLVAALFAKLHKVFEIKVLSSSCAFDRAIISRLSRCGLSRITGLH